MKRRCTISGTKEQIRGVLDEAGDTVADFEMLAEGMCCVHLEGSAEEVSKGLYTLSAYLLAGSIEDPENPAAHVPAAQEKAKRPRGRRKAIK